MMTFESIAGFILKSFDQAVSGFQTGGGPLLFAIFVMIFFAYLLGKSHGSNRDLQNKFTNTISKLDGIFGKLQRIENTVNSNFGNITKNFETVKETLFKNYERTKKIYKLSKKDSSTLEEQEDVVKVEDIFSKADDTSHPGCQQQLVQASEGSNIKRDSSVLSTETEPRSLWSKLKSILGEKKLDKADLEYVRERLLLADVGSELVENVVNQLLSANGSDFRAALRQVLGQRILIKEVEFARPQPGPRVFMFVGVNGVGKTSSVAKMAYILKSRGFKVMTVAGDTFRAGAEEQLLEWSRRIQVDCFYLKDADKPQTVVYDAIKKAISESFDYVLIDTAGRLHNKSHLMQELSGILKSIKKQLPNQPEHIFLVVDATTGQTALRQAEEFNEVIGINSLIVTKLDSSAKGGVLFAIFDKLKLPVSFVSLGEDVKSLMKFEKDQFLERFVA